MDSLPLQGLQSEISIVLTSYEDEYKPVNLGAKAVCSKIAHGNEIITVTEVDPASEKDDPETSPNAIRATGSKSTFDPQSIAYLSNTQLPF